MKAPNFVRTTTATASEGRKTFRCVDLQGSGYEYVLTWFASAKGQNVGQFYTPNLVVQCLVDIFVPFKSRIYDSARRSDGMLVQSEEVVESQGGKVGDISIFGQQSNATTRRLAITSLLFGGIERRLLLRAPRHISPRFASVYAR